MGCFKGCSKGKGAKNDKKNIGVKSNFEQDRIKAQENNRKREEIRKKEENRLKEENRNQDVVDTEAQPLGSPIEDRKRPIDVNDRARMGQIVMEAITNTKGLVTMPQIESYITEKYRNFPINSYRRRAIFTKVIADEFYKGQLAVRTNKSCS